MTAHPTFAEIAGSAYEGERATCPECGWSGPAAEGDYPGDSDESRRMACQCPQCGAPCYLDEYGAPEESPEAAARADIALIAAGDLRTLAALIEESRDPALQEYIARRLDVTLAAYFAAENAARES